MDRKFRKVTVSSWRRKERKMPRTSHTSSSRFIRGSVDSLPPLIHQQPDSARESGPWSPPTLHHQLRTPQGSLGPHQLAKQQSSHRALQPVRQQRISSDVDQDVYAMSATNFAHELGPRARPVPMYFQLSAHDRFPIPPFRSRTS